MFTLKTYFHRFISGGHFRSVVSNLSKTSGRVEICLDAQFIVNVIVSSEITHLVENMVWLKTTKLVCFIGQTGLY